LNGSKGGGGSKHSTAKQESPSLNSSASNSKASPSSSPAPSVTSSGHVENSSQPAVVSANSSSTNPTSQSVAKADTPAPKPPQQQQQHMSASVSSPEPMSSSSPPKDSEGVLMENFVPSQTGLPQLESNSPYYFPGYCGYLERVEAEQFIQFKPPGTFLIRWSDNKRFYVISYVDDQKRMQHMGNIEIGVDKKTTRVTKGNQRQFFPSVTAYIAFLRSKKMIDEPFESVAYITGEQQAKSQSTSAPATEYEDFDD